MGSLKFENDFKKSTIGKITLVFFGLMLLLTFFSNTINNYTLPKVRVESPVEGTLLKKITGDGVIEANDKMDIYLDAAINCRVADVKVEVGSRVNKGDVLAVINKDDLEKTRRMEMLAYEKLKLIYSEMLEFYNKGTNFKARQAELEIIKKNYEEAERKLKSVKELYDSGAAAYESYKDAERNCEILKSQYDMKVEEVNTSKAMELSNIKKFELDVKMQEEKLKAIDYESDVITSPFNGVVKEVFVTKGAWINNTSKLMTVSDTSNGFRFRADIDSESAEFVSPKDTASIKVISLGKQLLKGEVISVNESNKFKGVKKEVLVRIIPEDKSKSDENGNLLNQISGGEKGEIYIDKKTDMYGFVVPNSAVTPGISKDQGYVKLIKEKNSFLGIETYVEYKEVTILDSDNNHTAIEGGISVNDRIVVKTDKPISEKDRVFIEEQLENEAEEE